MTNETRIPLRAPEGWREAVEVSGHFGRRHDDEPIGPLVRLAFERGEDASREEYWLSRAEARALVRTLLPLVGEVDR